MERYYIDPKKDRLIREDVYKVRLEKEDGTVLSDLQPKRLFPFSRPNEYISLLQSVSGGPKTEAAVIKSLAELDEASRKAVNDCFEEYYMISRITRVVDTIYKFGSLRWTVDTDRGRVTFRIRNINSDIKMLDDKRMIIRDSYDNRYEIPDIHNLDRRSLRKLFAYT